MNLIYSLSFYVTSIGAQFNLMKKLVYMTAVVLSVVDQISYVVSIQTVIEISIKNNKLNYYVLY